MYKSENGSNELWHCGGTHYKHYILCWISGSNSPFFIPCHAMVYISLRRSVFFYTNHLAIWSSLCPLVPFPKSSLLPWSSD